MMSNRRWSRSFVLLGALLLGGVHSGIAWAWDDLGHEAVAEIAERLLTTKAKAFVFEILGTEPLAVSSTFPDHVRSDRRFSAFAPYHFVEIPFLSNLKNFLPQNRAKKDAHVILSETPGFLIHPNHSRSQKMILLRYLVHVVGDVHQPLHVGNGVDRGANLCEVQWKDPVTGRIIAQNLHTVWDGRIFDYVKVDFHHRNPSPSGMKRWFGYQELVDGILKEFDKASSEVKADLEKSVQAPVLDWYLESRMLHQRVYPDAKPIQSPETRTYCKRVDKSTRKVVNGAFDASTIPMLDEAYAAKALPIVKHQVLLGGRRLARMLNQLADRAPLKDSTDGADIKLLESVQLVNEHGHD